MAKDKVIYLKLKKSEADLFDLLTCKCNHNENNHFKFDRKSPCARCSCKQYRTKSIVGELFSEKDMRYGYHRY